jgi:hypothetical protein
MVFWRYIRHRNNAEAWVSREQFDKYQHKNRESVFKSRVKNPGSNKKSCHKWYFKNREHCIQKNREWRRNNRERHRAGSKEWVKNNKHKRAEYVKKWSAAHPEIIAAFRALRRSRQKNATPSLDKHQRKIISCLYETAKRVSDKTGIPHEVDHIIPLSKGGLHCPGNLQILPRSVNRRKWAKV